MTDLQRLIDRFWAITDRYNRDYREGRWDTNRELAGASEDAYSAAIAAGWDGRSR